jgi:bifunctional lysine-specific demethylase and histidyl-hydroxylase NO66
LDALSLLSGDAQAFVEKVWASHVHVHHTQPDDLTGLLSLDDVDHLLTQTGMRTPALRLAHDGQVLPASRFTRSATLAGVAMTGLVDARKVMDLFDDGATVVLQGLHRYWPPLIELVRDLELTLGHPCQANAYLTPPGSQGFALHHDSHDVFVFQTHGTKEWEIRDGSGRRQVVMVPGTSMYLPTGTPHAARTQASASLHVTVGVNAVTWREVMERAVRTVLDAEQWQVPLPAGYHDDEAALGAAIGARMATLAERIRAADPEATAAAEVQRLLTSRPAALRGGLRDRLAARSLHDDTPLRRRSGSVCVLVAEGVSGGDRLRVLLGDRELRVPGFLYDPLEHVRTHARLSPADLAPWLDEESRRVLARRLVVEGLLEVDE